MVEKDIAMNEQKLLSQRIEYLCKEKRLSYYALSYRSTVPLTTLMHIVDCSTKNPGIFTIIKICNGLDVTIQEFFDSKEFVDVEYEVEWGWMAECPHSKGSGARKWRDFKESLCFLALLCNCAKYELRKSRAKGMMKKICFSFYDFSGIIRT